MVLQVRSLCSRGVRIVASRLSEGAKHCCRNTTPLTTGSSSYKLCTSHKLTIRPGDYQAFPRNYFVAPDLHSTDFHRLSTDYSQTIRRPSGLAQLLHAHQYHGIHRKAWIKRYCQTRRHQSKTSQSGCPCGTSTETNSLEMYSVPCLETTSKWPLHAPTALPKRPTKA